jgi:VWFA-related protein
MSTGRVLASRVLLISLALCPIVLLGQPPTFRTAVELMRLDVTVVTDDGTPVADLSPADFEVTIKGAPRPVVSAQFLSAATATSTAAAPQPGDFSSNAESGGRLFLVVIDEMSLQQGKERPLVEGLRDFVSDLGPRDRTAVLSIPGATARVDFTNDSSTLRAAVDRIRAWPPEGIAREPIRIDRGEGGTTTLAAPLTPAEQLSNDFDTMVDTLNALAVALTPVEGPKTLLLVSGRLPGGFGQLATSQQFARRAAEARMKVYAIRHIAVPGEAQSGTGSNDGPEDPLTGFHLLAGTSGGAVFDAVARAKGVFERIDRESSGSYVLGIEPPPGTAADSPLEVKVRVRRAGVTVRSRTQVLLPPERATRKDPTLAVREALQQPRPATELSIRLASYAARGSDPALLKTIIAAEFPGLGNEEALTWGYEIRSGGKPVTNAIDRLAQGARPGALTTAVNLAPGTYSLRLAAATADGRLGGVDHTLVVAPHGTSRVGFSDVFVGEAVDGRFQPRISLGRDARECVTFVEVYASGGEDGTIGVEFEVEGADGPVGAAVPASLAGSGGKRLAQATLPIGGLDAGRYSVTATVRAGTEVIGTAQRSVLVER